MSIQIGITDSARARIFTHEQVKLYSDIQSNLLEIVSGCNETGIILDKVRFASSNQSSNLVAYSTAYSATPYKLLDVHRANSYINTTTNTFQDLTIQNNLVIDGTVLSENIPLTYLVGSNISLYAPHGIPKPLTVWSNQNEIISLSPVPNRFVLQPNVGIGTTLANYKLHVQGGAHAVNGVYTGSLRPRQVGEDIQLYGDLNVNGSLYIGGTFSLAGARLSVIAVGITNVDYRTRPGILLKQQSGYTPLASWNVISGTTSNTMFGVTPYGRTYLGRDMASVANSNSVLQEEIYSRSNAILTVALPVSQSNDMLINLIGASTSNTSAISVSVSMSNTTITSNIVNTIYTYSPFYVTKDAYIGMGTTMPRHPFHIDLYMNSNLTVSSNIDTGDITSNLDIYSSPIPYNETIRMSHNNTSNKPFVHLNSNSYDTVHVASDGSLYMPSVTGAIKTAAITSNAMLYTNRMVTASNVFFTGHIASYNGNASFTALHNVQASNMNSGNLVASNLSLSNIGSFQSINASNIVTSILQVSSNTNASNMFISGTLSGPNISLYYGISDTTYLIPASTGPNSVALFTASNVLISAQSNFTDELNATASNARGVLQVSTYPFTSSPISAGISVYGYNYSSMLVSTHRPYYILQRSNIINVTSSYNMTINTANELCIGAHSNNQLGDSVINPGFKLNADTGIVTMGNDRSLLYSRRDGSIMASTVANAPFNLSGTGGFESVGTAYFRTVTSNPVLFMDNNTGNMGIGTTLVRRKLDIQGDAIIASNLAIGTDTAQARLHIQGNTYMCSNVGIGTMNTAGILGTLSLAMEGSLYTASLGIGTTIPLAPLHVAQAQAVLVTDRVGISTIEIGTQPLQVNGAMRVASVLTTGTGLTAPLFVGALGGVANAASYASNAYGTPTAVIPASYVITSNLGVTGTALFTSSQLGIDGSNTTIRAFTSITSNMSIRNTTATGPALSVYQHGSGAPAAAATASFYDVGVSTTTPALTIGLNGNTGVGTSAPTTALHVQGTGYHSSNLGIGTSVPISRIQLTGDALVQGTLGIGTTTGAFIAGPTTAYPGGLYNTGMTYISSNVGIGTTVSHDALHVATMAPAAPRRQGALFTGVPYNSTVAVHGSNYARFGVGGGISLHTAAVDGDGRVYTWGNNGFGQLGNGSTTSSNAPQPVSTYGSLQNKTVVSVACGGYHTVAIDRFGAAYAWGYNNHGQLGNSTRTDTTTPIRVYIGPMGTVGVRAISCGLYHTAAIDANGNLYTWGNNIFGQLGRGGAWEAPAQVPRTHFAQSNIVAVACGSIHTAAVDSSGNVYTWGFNGAGELGNNAAPSVSNQTPILISSYGSLSGKTIVAIACGGYHTAALDSTGVVHTWGYNGYGQLGNGTTTNSKVPVSLSAQGSLSGKTIAAIACGNTHTVALDTLGGLHAWGLNGTGQLGNGTTTNSSTPIAIQTYGALLSKTIVSMSCGYYHTAAMDTQGNVYTWGYNGYGQIGNGSTTQQALPVYAIRMLEQQAISTEYPYMLLGTMVQYAASNYALPSANGKINGVSITSIHGRTRASYASASNSASSWQTRTSAADNAWSSVCWAPELPLFCAVGTSGTPGPYVMTSPDGVTWTAQAGDPSNTNSWSCVCWSPELSLFCSVASAGASGYRAMTSTDGATWTLRATPADNAWSSVCWAPEIGLFCAVSSDNMSTSVMTSTNGTSWTQVTLLPVSYTGSHAWTSVCWSPDLSIFCCVSQDGGVMTSSNGQDWTIYKINSTNSWRSVCWSPELSLFCAVADTGTGDRIMTSPDGLFWTIGTSPADYDWNSVCWSPQLSLFCAVADTGPTNRVMFSQNGTTWTLAGAAVDNEWNSVCWAPELSIFCAVADTGTGTRVMTSRPAVPAELSFTQALPSSPGIIPIRQNVGIGTTLPNNRLDVMGIASLSGSVGIGTTIVPTSYALYALGGSGSTALGIGTTLAPALLTLPAGTSTVPPMLLTAGALLSTARAGSVEYDGALFMMSTRDSTRSAPMNEQMAMLNSPYLLTNSTTYQQLLNVSTNGSVTVPAGTTVFECYFALSNLNSTSASFGFGLSGANISTQAWSARAAKSDAASANLAMGHFTAAEPNLVSANTGSNCFAHIRGIIKMSAAGTVTPQVSLTVANTSAYVTEGSYFRIQTLASSYNTNVWVGNWS